jgi:hypothetical protein
MHGGKFSGHGRCLSVVIHDRHVAGVGAVSAEAHAPLIVAADAPLAGAPNREHREVNRRRQPQFVGLRCGIDRVQRLERALPDT